MRIEIRNVMCTTDLSDSSRLTIPYGVALAKELGAKLYICHVADIPSADTYGSAIPDPIIQEEEILKYVNTQLNELMENQTVEWEPLVAIGRASDEICRMVEEKSIDIAISATKGRTGLKRIVLGSVTGRLMRTIPCPLLIVRSKKKEQIASVVQEIKFNRILVGVDFSSDSELAFQYGLSLAKEFESELHLIHVIVPADYKAFIKIKSENELHKALPDQVMNELKDMLNEEDDIWCRPIFSVLDGQTYDEINKYAFAHDIDLIVLGVRGHGVAETLFVGSTTDRVARQAPCPVLSVRPKG